MKNKALLILLFTIPFFNNSFGQWTQSVQPTGGGYCWSIERVGSEIWAAYEFGIYVSDREGAIWHKHPTISYRTLDIKSIGDTVFLLIQQKSGTIYKLSTVRSTDNGLTWGAPVVVETDNYYFAYGNRQILETDSALIINSNGNYFYSLNFGQTWNAVVLPSSLNSYITTVSVKFMICYVYNTIGVTYYSNNSGRTWNYLDSNFVSSQALIIDSSIYIPMVDNINSQYFIMRTTDFGQSWDTLAQNLNVYGTLNCINGIIYLYPNTNPQNNFLYESSDGGNTWTISALPVELFWINEEESVLLNNWEWLVNLGYGGINRYNPSTLTKFKTETGIKAHKINYLKANNGILFAKTDEKIFRSNDAGSTWGQLPSYISQEIDLAFKGDTVLSLTNPYGSTSAICYSYDNGLTWDSLTPILQATHMNPRSICIMNDAIYIGCMNYVAVSRDWGTTWNSLSINKDNSCSPGLYFSNQLIECNNELYLFDNLNNQVYKYDSTAFIWKLSLCVSTPGVQFEKLYSLGNKLAYSNGGIFKVSADSGATWTTPNLNGWPSGYYPTSISSIHGTWYAASASGKLYYSLNSGNNWQQLPTNSEMVVTSFADGLTTELNGILYVGGNNIWRNSGTLNLISGTVYFDNNSSGIRDANETGIANVLLHSSPNNIAFSTDEAGNYNFLTAAVGDTLKPNLPSSFCSVLPAYHITSTATTGIDFGIYFYSGVRDLSCNLTNTSPFRPGFYTPVNVYVKNNGSVAMPGILTVVLDSNLNYVNASQNPMQVNGDTIIFTIDTLQLLESKSITITVETSFLTMIGTQVFLSAMVSPLAGDTMPFNNSSYLHPQVVGAFDPNDKSASCGDFFSPSQVQNGEEIVYTIRFQNVGNFVADNIHINDTLSAYFNLADFKLVSTSHPMYFTMEGNGILNFYFDSILLPPSSVDEVGSHGFVKYSIKCNSALSLGDAFENKAAIYFDFNAPVQTNTVTTLVAFPPINVGTSEIQINSPITIYPNPVSEILYGSIAGKVQSLDVTIINRLGICVKSSKFRSNKFSFNVTDLPPGLYLGKLLTDAESTLFFRFIVVK